MWELVDLPKLNRRKFLVCGIGLGLATQLNGCSQTVQPYRAQIPVFGTLVDLLIYCASSTQANRAIYAVEQTFHQFHQDWHAWEQGGILSKINQAIATQTPISVADSVKDFIQTSQQLCRQSLRLFDPGIGKLVALWGFHSEQWQGPPPDKPLIQQWLDQRPSILDLSFQGNQLTANNPQVQLDFGGNAKGLALDIAMQSLKNSKVDAALVSIGGDMKALGVKPNGTPWQVGVQSPENPQQTITQLKLYANESLVTSGTYQRFFEWQGKHYSHLINPNTGWPVDTEQSFVSVTVIHPDAMRADAAASALLIAGKSQWQKVASQMDISLALAIDAEGRSYQLGNLGNRMQN